MRDISLVYGTRQSFRYRHEDLNILGSTSLDLPVTRSVYQLNDGPPVHFYVEPETGTDDPGKYPWKAATPSVNRLRDRPGHFNIEIPTGSESLRSGTNHIGVAIQGADGRLAEAEACFTWNPRKIDLPIELDEMQPSESIQAIGQVVDGTWEIEGTGGSITTRAPVARDSLLLIGSPWPRQEAVYHVEFGAPLDGYFVGLSDFFVRHDEQSAGLGIKPGYSTAGLATARPRGELQCWMAMGDSIAGKEWAWVEKSAPYRMTIAPNVIYKVRHQLLIENSVSLSRFRFWPAEKREPKQWLCTVHNASLAAGHPTASAASFGLFQNCGQPTRWSNIVVRELSTDVDMDKLVRATRITNGIATLRDGARTLAKRTRRKLFTVRKK